MIESSLAWNPLELLDAIANDTCDYGVFTFSYVSFQKQGVRFVPVPSFSDAPSRGAVVGGTGLAVSAHSRYPKAAQNFARFVGSEFVQTRLWAQNGGQPAHRCAWEQLAKTDPFYRDLQPAIETAYIRPRFSGWNTLQSQLGNLICNWLGDEHAKSEDLDKHIRQHWKEFL